jgi:hypothetical protein
MSSLPSLSCNIYFTLISLYKGALKLDGLAELKDVVAIEIVAVSISFFHEKRYRQLFLPLYTVPT